MLWFFAACLVSHFVGDFPLQSSWMASGKGRSVYPLLVHIGVYTAAFFVVSFGLLSLASVAGLSVPAYGVAALAWFALANGLSHFCVDLVTSRITSWAWGKGKTRLFFTVIGADQLAHYLLILAFVPLLLR